MRRKVSAASLAAIALLLGVLAGCGGEEATEAEVTTSESSGGAASGDPIKIGILAGITGDYGPWGEAGLDASQVAVDEINEAGGVLGRPLELVPFDHASKVERAISGWKKLVEVDNVTAVGGMESDGAIALLDEAAEAEVPIMCPACGTPVLDEKGGDYVWRLTGGDTDLGVVLAQLALTKTKQVAALTQQGLSATEDITNIFLESFEKGGGEVVADVRFSAEAPTFQAELEQAFSKADWVLVSTGLDTGSQILSEWARRGYGGNLILIPELVVEEIVEAAGDELDGKAYGVNPTYDTSTPAYESFAPRYRELAGKDPSAALYEPAYYDQIVLFALAAVAAGEVSGKGIRDHLSEVSNEPGVKVTSFADGLRELDAGNEIDYDGASGEIAFDDSGSVSSTYAELVLQGGDWSEGDQITLDPALRP